MGVGLWPSRAALVAARWTILKLVIFLMREALCEAQRE
jgi:hypothetical protein